MTEIYMPLMATSTSSVAGHVTTISEEGTVINFIQGLVEAVQVCTLPKFHTLCEKDCFL